MKSEKRNVVEQRNEIVYIAEDGKEFSDKYSCKDYETELKAIQRGIPRVRAVDVDDCYNRGSMMWYLSYEEDFEWLVSEYCYDGVIDESERKFGGPGWYLVYFVECYDSPDEWHIERLETKMNELEKRISNLRRLQDMEIKPISRNKPEKHQDQRFYRHD